MLSIYLEFINWEGTSIGRAKGLSNNIATQAHTQNQHQRKLHQEFRKEKGTAKKTVGAKNVQKMGMASEKYKKSDFLGSDPPNKN